MPPSHRRPHASRENSSSSAVSAPTGTLSSSSLRAPVPRADPAGSALLAHSSRKLSSFGSRVKRSIVGTMKAPLRGAAREVARIGGKGKNKKEDRPRLEDSPMAYSTIDTCESSETSMSILDNAKDVAARRESWDRFCRLFDIPFEVSSSTGKGPAPPSPGESSSPFVTFNPVSTNASPLADPREDRLEEVWALGGCVVPSLPFEDSADRRLVASVLAHSPTACSKIDTSESSETSARRESWDRFCRLLGIDDLDLDQGKAEARSRPVADLFSDAQHDSAKPSSFSKSPCRPPQGDVVALSLQEAAVGSTAKENGPKTAATSIAALPPPPFDGCSPNSDVLPSPCEALPLPGKSSSATIIFGKAGQWENRLPDKEASGGCVIPSLSSEASASPNDARVLAQQSDLSTPANRNKPKKHTPSNRWRIDDQMERGEEKPESETHPSSLALSQEGVNRMRLDDTLTRVVSRRAEGKVAIPDRFHESYSKSVAKVNRWSEQRTMKEGENAIKSNRAPGLSHDLTSDRNVCDSRVDSPKNDVSEEMEDDCSIPSVSLEEEAYPVGIGLMPDVSDSVGCGSRDAANSALAWTALVGVLSSPAPSSVVKRSVSRQGLWNSLKGSDGSVSLPEIHEDANAGIASGDATPEGWAPDCGSLGPINLDDLIWDEVSANNLLGQDVTDKEVVDSVLAWGALGMVFSAPVPSSIEIRSSSRVRLGLWDNGEVSDVLPEIDEVSEALDTSLKGSRQDLTLLQGFDICDEEEELDLNELEEANEGEKLGVGKEGANSVLAWGALGMILGAPAPKSVFRRHSSRLSLNIFEDGEDCDSIPDIGVDGNGAGLCLVEDEIHSNMNSEIEQEPRDGATLDCFEELDLNELEDTNIDREVGGTKGFGRQGADSVLGWSAMGMIVGLPVAKPLLRNRKRRSSQHLFDDGCDATADNLDGLLSSAVDDPVGDVVGEEDKLTHHSLEAIPLGARTPKKEKRKRRVGEIKGHYVEREKERDEGMVTGAVYEDAGEKADPAKLPLHDDNISRSRKKSSSCVALQQTEENALATSAILGNCVSNRANWVRALKRKRREEVQALVWDRSLAKDERDRRVKEVKRRYYYLISLENASEAHGNAAAARTGLYSPELQEEKKE